VRLFIDICVAVEQQLSAYLSVKRPVKDYSHESNPLLMNWVNRLPVVITKETHFYSFLMKF